MTTLRTTGWVAWALTLYIAFVFVQSLFFKFSDSPETQYIFGTLDAWAGSLGVPGLFAPRGPFSQYVVGSVELLASALLLAGLLLGRPTLHAAGALLAIAVISGAIFFHLFTPLGVQVRNTDGSLDGGELFALACGVWIASVVLLVTHRHTLRTLLQRRRAAVA
jgi:FtsH-binding integral membrane protein